MHKKKNDTERRKALAEEERNLHRLRRLIDFVSQLLALPDTSIIEAYGLIRYARAEALRLFPGKELAFELLYHARFRRILETKMSLQAEIKN